MENYPILQKYFFGNYDLSNYLNWSDKMVDNIQFNNTKKQIPLTFYPIAKNIRTASSYMSLNISNNQASFIDNLARGGEENFWKNNLNRGEWFPWLWARGRIPGNYNNIDGWKLYFLAISV